MAMAGFVLAPVACALGPALRGVEIDAFTLTAAMAAALAGIGTALLAALVRAGLRAAAGDPGLAPVPGGAVVCILIASAGVVAVAGLSGRAPLDAVPPLLAATAAGAALVLTGRARRGKAFP
jgi:hypothetical protein